jgi:putative ABC transport system ATP-binding protein
MISISNLRFRYPEGEFELNVPRLEVAAGESVAVIGPSGSGKTTLLHLMAGIQLPQLGKVRTDDIDITDLDDGARRDFRIRRIGLVFQEFELLEYLTVLDNILLPYRINGSLTLDREARDRAAAVANQVGIADKLNRLSTKLSHGEKQRVAVCRALIAEPVLLLADEPTGNLDPTNTGRVLDILLDAAEATGATLVTVTHDHELLTRFDRSINIMDLISPQITQIDADMEEQH